MWSQHKWKNPYVTGMNSPKLIKGRDSPRSLDQVSQELCRVRVTYSPLFSLSLKVRQDCVVMSHRYNVNGLTQPPSSGCTICYGNCHRPKHQSSPTNWKASLNLFEMFPVARSNFIKWLSIARQIVGTSDCFASPSRKSWNDFAVSTLLILILLV